MNLVRAIDARFLLARSPRSVEIHAPHPGWSGAFAAAGIDVVGPGEGEAIFVGRSGKAQRRRGQGAHFGRWSMRAPRSNERGWLMLPDAGAAELTVATSARGAEVLADWRVESGVREIRNRAGRAVLARGRFPPARDGVRTWPPAPPWPVTVFRDLVGTASPASVLVAPGAGDLARVVLLLVPGRAHDGPSFALKCGRLPASKEAFDGDEEGLALAAAAGGVVAAHTPRLLGRTEVDGLSLSVETAGHGRPLLHLLREQASQTFGATSLDVVASWAVNVAESTLAPPSALTELWSRMARIAEQVGLDPTHVAGLVRSESVRAVLHHADLVPGNVLVTPTGGFTVVDWGEAVRHGPPLWDVLSLVAEGLAALEGPATAAGRESALHALLTGRSERSSTLFSWIQRAAVASGVNAAHIGPLVTLAWVDRWREDVGEELFDREVSRKEPPSTGAGRMAIDWLQDPAMGPGWPAFKAWLGRGTP